MQIILVLQEIICLQKQLKAIVAQESLDLSGCSCTLSFK